MNSTEMTKTIKKTVLLCEEVTQVALKLYCHGVRNINAAPTIEV
jgi:hypothetical protein